MADRKEDNDGGDKSGGILHETGGCKGVSAFKESTRSRCPVNRIKKGGVKV